MKKQNKKYTPLFLICLTIMFIIIMDRLNNGIAPELDCSDKYYDPDNYPMCKFYIGSCPVCGQTNLKSNEHVRCPRCGKKLLWPTDIRTVND